MAHTHQIVDTQVQSGPPNKAVTDRSVPQQIGGYEIREEIGRGGMGIVYRAFDPDLKRFVALKVLSGGAEATVDALVRFRGEAEVIARLHHPNIVEIFDSGQYEGQQYLVLELVEGGSLDKQISGVPQQPRDAATTIETIARAVAVAHAAGIVHRDLKPANVLRSTSGTLKITDFGLAKQLDQSLGVSRSGDLRGTPQYMAPEQAGRRGATIGPATDVYALGAMLYELLTGRPPFVANNLLDMLDQILDTDATSPSRLVPKLPRDLCTICLKCLEKEPGRRYPSARELADDLRRWLDGHAILARPLSRSEWTARFVRRHPLPVAFVTTLGLTIAGFVWYVIAAQADYADQLEQHYEVAQQALDEISDRIIRDPRLARDKQLLTSLANHFHDMVESQRELPTASPQRLARAYEVRGQLLAMTAESQKAAEAYQRSLDYWTAATSDSFPRQLARASVNLELGKLYRELRQFPQAAAAYDVAEQILGAGEVSPRQQRILAEVWHQRGILFDPFRGKREALAAYNEGLRIRQSLGTDPETIRDLARSHGYIGDVYMGLGDGTAAETAYQQSHDLRTQTAQTSKTPDALFQLARSHGNFAILYASSGRWADALARFQEARALQEELLKREGDIPEYLSDYGGTLSRLAEAHRLIGKNDDALKLAEQAVGILHILHDKDPQAAVYRSGLADALIQSALTKIDHRPNDVYPALAEARALLHEHERNEVDRYNSAAVTALLNERPGADPAQLSSAFAALEEALAKGYYRKNRRVIADDRAWAKLRNHPDFQRLMK